MWKTSYKAFSHHLTLPMIQNKAKSTHFGAVNYKAYETQACQRSSHSRCQINSSHSLPQALQ